MATVPRLRAEVREVGRLPGLSFECLSVLGDQFATLQSMCTRWTLGISACQIVWKEDEGRNGRSIHRGAMHEVQMHFVTHFTSRLRAQLIFFVLGYGALRIGPVS